jgi:hypothetical protein
VKINLSQTDEFEKVKFDGFVKSPKFSFYVIPAPDQVRGKLQRWFDRFDRFDKLTACKLTAGRLTILLVLLVLLVLSTVEGSTVEGSAVEGSEVEGESCDFDKFWIPPDRVRGRLIKPGVTLRALFTISSNFSELYCR